MRRKAQIIHFGPHETGDFITGDGAPLTLPSPVGRGGLQNISGAVPRCVALPYFSGYLAKLIILSLELGPKSR